MKELLLAVAAAVIAVVVLLTVSSARNWAAASFAPAAVTPSAPSQAVTRPVAAAFVQLAQSLSNRSGNLPGGCAILAGQTACVPKVSIDGQPLADIAVLAKLVGVTGEPGAGSTSLTSPSAVQSAIAAAVFDHLLYVQGVADGFTASTAQATAVAQQQLNAYLNDPQRAQHASVIPQTPQAYFLSPASIAVYARGLVVGQERQKIAAALPPATDPTPTYRAWLGAELAHHSVTINGAAPNFSLPDALPERP